MSKGPSFSKGHYYKSDERPLIQGIHLSQMGLECFSKDTDICYNLYHYPKHLAKGHQILFYVSSFRVLQHYSITNFRQHFVFARLFV